MKFLLMTAMAVCMSITGFAQWSITGNTGTSPSTNYLGTTDANDLVIRTNATERLRVLKTGEVGIGKVPLGLALSSYTPHINVYQPVLQVESIPLFTNPAGTYPNPIASITATGISSQSLVFGVTSRGGWINSYGPTGTTLWLGTKVEIGNYVITNMTTPGDYGLYVAKGILTEKVKVAVATSANWADYVFNKDYKLLSLGEVEKYVKKNKHLPGVPSADEVVKEGVDVVAMDAKLLQKIEELTLYMIEMKKENEVLKKRVLTLEQK